MKLKLNMYKEFTALFFALRSLHKGMRNDMQISSLQLKISVSLIMSSASKLPVPYSYQNMRDK